LSSVQYLTSGVIQGSCLGPILFVLYINDIESVFDQCCVSKLYADDLKLYMRMSIAGCARTFQECINKLTSWSQTWQLGISHSFFFSLHFLGRRKTDIPKRFTVSTRRDLVPNRTFAIPISANCPLKRTGPKNTKLAPFSCQVADNYIAPNWFYNAKT